MYIYHASECEVSLELELKKREAPVSGLSCVRASCDIVHKGRRCTEGAHAHLHHAQHCTLCVLHLGLNAEKKHRDEKSVERYTHKANVSPS